MVGAPDTLEAWLAERAGFDGVWSSGLEVSASRGGPDPALRTTAELLAAARCLAAAVRIPVVADCDTGGGDLPDVVRLVGTYEAAGVAAVCLADAVPPKVDDLPNHREHEFVRRIAAAKDTQRTLDFMVIARIEVGPDVGEALRQGHTYGDAGADAVLIHAGGRSPEPVLRFAAAWDRDMPVVVPTSSHTLTPAELEHAGVNMVIYDYPGRPARFPAVPA
jgi:phosphoenolpyruvate phosphomutase